MVTSVINNGSNIDAIILMTVLVTIANINLPTNIENGSAIERRYNDVPFSSSSMNIFPDNVIVVKNKTIHKKPA